MIKVYTTEWSLKMEAENQVSDRVTTGVPADSVSSSTPLYGSTSSSLGFCEKTKKTDLTLVVGGKNVYVTRAVLELMSPKFQALLEANEDKLEIILDGKDASEFVEFLACFYPGKGHRVTKENVFKMLPLATEYDIVHVINQCETCFQALLKSSETPSDIFLCILRSVYEFKLVELKQECLEALERRSLGDMLRAGDSDVIPNEAKADMYTALVPKLIKDVVKYRYLYTGLNKKKAKILDELKEADYITLTMSMKADIIGEQNSETVEDLNKRWSIKVTRYMSKGVLGAFNVSVLCEHSQKTTLDSSECLLTIVVKNSIPWKDHVIKELEFVMKPENFTTQNIRIQEPSVFDKEAGFITDKHYTIEAHILVNERHFKGIDILK